MVTYCFQPSLVTRNPNLTLTHELPYIVREILMRFEFKRDRVPTYSFGDIGI